MALLDEPYTISPPRTGDARISRLVLTGWSAGFAAWTEDGRAYWDVVSNVLTMWTTELRTGATTRLCSGTISSGVVTLAALNSSGISGTARVTHTVDSIGDVIISYASEQDLSSLCHSSSSLLSSSAWAGVTHFEEAFRLGKGELDRWLPAKIDNVAVRTATGEYDLSVVAKPRQLAETHGLLTLAFIFDRMASITMDTMHFEMVDRYRKRAREVFNTVRLDINYDEDEAVDARGGGGSVQLVRG